MLAILVIDPSRLALLNGTIHSSYWQTFSNVALTIAAVLWLILSLLRPKVADTPSPLFEAQSSSHHATNKLPPPQASTSLVLTPFVVLGQHGVLHLCMRLLCVLLILVAVVGNTLAQRMAAIAIAPTHDIYVDAMVTPDGLSDRRLELARATPTDVKHTAKKPGAQSAQSKNQVVEGYRQLVTLTQIQPATTANFKGDDKGVKKGKTASSMTQNPFTETAAGVQNAVTPRQKKADKRAPSSLNGLNGIDKAVEPPRQMTVMLATFKRDAAWLNELAPNQQVKMRLKLSPLEINNNRHEFNEYRWLSTRHAVASAKIVAVDKTQLQTIDNLSLWQKINQFRYHLRLHFLSLTDEHHADVTVDGSHESDELYALDEKADAIAVTLSLLTGDRSLISKDMTGLYRFAGISHLLAISGAHVLFLAILSASLAAMLANRFCPYLYRVLPRWQLKFLVAVLAAFAYAMFAGFDVPAMRTAWMLVIIGLLRYLLVSTSVYKVLLLLGVGMAWQDIFVLWQAGFWLSFVAVAMLIVYSQAWKATQLEKETLALLKTPSNAHTVPTNTVKIKRLLWAFFKLQLWMSVALLPISLWLFGKVSLWGFIVNLFAIGLFGWVIVPLNLLAGLIYVFTPKSLGIADLVWQFIFWILTHFHHLLLWLQTSMGQIGWLHNDIHVATMFLLLLLTLPWLLPKGLLSRVLALPALAAVFFLVFVPDISSHDPEKNMTHITVLDTANAKVTALLISHDHQHWLLLSTYSNANYAKIGAANVKDAPQQGLSAKQVRQLSQTLYDQLQLASVTTLTGVIGQTATPDTAKVVANLRHDMPISNYWQAGLTADKVPVQAALQGLGLSAQECALGKVWSAVQSEQTASERLNFNDNINDSRDTKTNNKTAAFVLTAVTGWPKIEDRTVWDCTLQLNSAYPVVLTQTTTHKENSAKQTAETIEIAKAGEEVVLYGSRHLRLAKLWQLMCQSPANPQPTGVQHWLLNAQAQISPAIIDEMPPQSWHVVRQPNQPVSANLTEAKLYWQQQYADPK